MGRDKGRKKKNKFLFVVKYSFFSRGKKKQALFFSSFEFCFCFYFYILIIANLIFIIFYFFRW